VTSHQSDSGVDDAAIARVIGGVEVVLRAAAPIAAPERDLLWKRFGDRSKDFQRAHDSVSLFELGFVTGALLLLAAVLTNVGDAEPWLTSALIVTGLICVGIPGIRMYGIVQKALAVAIGAYIVACKGGADEDF